jgi:hypothetical protein
MSRPTLTGETLTVQQVRLTAAQIATARRLGQGNLSAGVRAALENTDDRENAVKNAIDRLPHAPWKDRTATEAVWLLSLALRR